MFFIGYNISNFRNANEIYSPLPSGERLGLPAERRDETNKGGKNTPAVGVVESYFGKMVLLV